MRTEMRTAPTPMNDLSTVPMTGRAAHEYRIGLEISAEKLYQLLACGAISLSDFRCLNCASKQQVRRLCLYACAQQLHKNALVTTPSLQPISS